MHVDAVEHRAGDVHDGLQRRDIRCILYCVRQRAVHVELWGGQVLRAERRASRRRSRSLRHALL